MWNRRNLILGLVFIVAAVIPVLALVRSESPNPTNEFAGKGTGFLAPHETPFPQAQQVSLGTSRSIAGFPVFRPDHAIASDETLTDVWVSDSDPSSQDSEVQVALWYASGIEVHLSLVSPNDPDPLISDFPVELPVTYEKIGGMEARLVPPGVLSPDQPGSVALIRDNVMITVFGWAQDVTSEQLRDIAATIQ